MKSERKTVTVTILDKAYQVACPLGEQVALVASARHLDQTMRDIRGSGKVIGMERISVMAALNMTNDLLRQNAESDANSRYSDNNLQRIHEKLDNALERFANSQT